MLVIKDFFQEFMNDILFASSQENVKDICDKAINKLTATMQVPADIQIFSAKAVAELELFNPMDKTAQQWSNINMAKICFRHYLKNQTALEGS